MLRVRGGLWVNASGEGSTVASMETRHGPCGIPRWDRSKWGECLSLGHGIPSLGRIEWALGRELALSTLEVFGGEEDLGQH